MRHVRNDSASESRGASRAEAGSGRPGGARLLAAVVLVLAALTLLPPAALPGACAAEAPGGAAAASAAPAGDASASPAGEAKAVPAGEAKAAPEGGTDAATAAGEPAGKPAGEKAAVTSPWAFSFGLYVWLPGVYADFSSGDYDASASVSILDIFQKTKGIPLTCGGHIEGWWKRLGAYVDGNYFYLNFRDRDIQINSQDVSTGILAQIGILEYYAMFRVTGAPAGAEVSGWAKESGPPRLDLYAGGRTTWLDIDIEPEGFSSESNSSTLTSPLVGLRFALDLAPRWFFLLEGDVGGFGVDDVDFAGEGLAAFGYRTHLFGAPMALSLGYKVLYLDIETDAGDHRIETDLTLHGPVLDLTLAW